MTGSEVQIFSAAPFSSFSFFFFLLWWPSQISYGNEGQTHILEEVFLKPSRYSFVLCISGNILFASYKAEYMGQFLDHFCASCKKAIWMPIFAIHENSVFDRLGWWHVIKTGMSIFCSKIIFSFAESFVRSIVIGTFSCTILTRSFGTRSVAFFCFSYKRFWPKGAFNFWQYSVIII